MSSEACHLTLSLSVEVDFKSLENIGIFIENRCSNFAPKLVVGITGNTCDLGSWNPEKGVSCKRQKTADDGVETWRCRFTTHIRHSFEFRYFIAELKQNNDEYSDSDMLRVLAWESRLHPRVFTLIDYLNAEHKDIFTHVKFGVFEDGRHIQKGWLTSNSELHIRVSGSSCKFFSCTFANNSQSQHQLYISCSKYVVQSCDEDFDADSGLFAFTHHGKPQPVLLSIIEANRCHVHRGENTECWGTYYKPGDDVTFYIETGDTENTAVVIEFYRQELVPCNTESNPLRLVGCARYGPFDGTYGRKASQILSSKQVPVGDLRIQYLIVHPMTKAPQPSLAVTYQHHWKKRETANIGHRGMGTSFFELSERATKKPATTKENTLDSFRTAVQHGADFVEMDVQLTKDRKVVVYHDYETVIISKKKRNGQLSYLPIAIKDLNYEDLRELKVHHSSVLHEGHTHEKMNEDDLDPVELQSFPLLQDCFREIDPDLGFVIEVKYPMEFKAGGCEMANFFEYNFYVDTILREILAFAGKRRILLSCFDPNVCAMLQLKQNIYPVFQLGIAPEYADSRLANFERLFWSALGHQLLGVCLESDSLLKVPSVVDLAHRHGLVVLAWGEAVNCPEKRAEIISLGVEGIIFDRLHEHKESGALNMFKKELAASSPLLLAPVPQVTHAIGVSVSPTLPSCVSQAMSSPVKGTYGPTYVAVVRECVQLDKLSHTNSTTTCESFPVTSDVTPNSQYKSDVDGVLGPVISVASGSQPEATINVTSSGVSEQNSSSAPHAVPVITLA